MIKQLDLFGQEKEILNINDEVNTPEDVAIKIIKEFKPTGKILEPCIGSGNFYRNLPPNTDWCEIRKGKDFFNYNKKVNWIITNPPYSIYTEFLEHSYKIANNVVFLIPLGKIFSSIGKVKSLKQYGGIKKILVIGAGTDVGFPFGFPCGAVHYKKGYKGKIEFKYGETHINKTPPVNPTTFTEEEEEKEKTHV